MTLSPMIRASHIGDHFPISYDTLLRWEKANRG